MSNISEKASEIQYILDDTEFMIDPSNLKPDAMNDIIYTDGNQAFVVNGHFLQEGDTPTLVLQEGEDISQYLINDDKGELLIANIQNGSVSQQQETQQIVQYVDEEGNITDPPEILFIKDDGTASTQEGNSTQYQLAELIETDVLQNDENETVRLLDINNLTQQQSDGVAMDAVDWYHFNVARDNIVTKNADLQLDVSTIRGKNLLTGQEVTLDGYMNKLQRKIKTISKNSISWQRPKHNLNAFLNKKFNLGLTVGGRPLVGKIVYVGNKELEVINQQGNRIVNGDNMKMGDNEVRVAGTSSICDPETDQMHIQTKLLSKKSGQFQKMSKTLSDLMNMEDVNKQLHQKSIRIKIMDKYYDFAKKPIQHVSFISGYMESKKENSDKNEVEEWSFVPDTLKAERISEKKYPESVNLTIMTTYQNNQSIVQVIFDEPKELECTYCYKTFKNKPNMVWHLNDVHKKCENCNIEFNSFEEVLRHKKIQHSQLVASKPWPVSECQINLRKDSSLKKHKLVAFKCPTCPYSGISEEDLKIHSKSHQSICDICGEVFVSENKLNSHKRKHSKREYLKVHSENRSSRCDISCEMSENENKLNSHKKTHSKSELNVLKKINSTKYYSCHICKRTFSRQSNLQRHIEIHKGAEQLFRCAICECSYHYISSLTRHIVQNHVQIQRSNYMQGTDGTAVNI